jgi:competence protein ComEC
LRRVSPNGGAGRTTAADGGSCRGDRGAAVATIWGCASRRLRANRCRPMDVSRRTPARAWTRAEAGAGRLLPWVPVAFGTGIAFYFAADREPVLPVAAATAIGLCGLAFGLRRHRFFPILVMIAAVAAGFATAVWRATHVAHAVLARPLYSVSLSGFVETRDIRERTDRFVLRVTRMEAARDQIQLERVRLSVKKGTAPRCEPFASLP